MIQTTQNLILPLIPLAPGGALVKIKLQVSGQIPSKGQKLNREELSSAVQQVAVSLSGKAHILNRDAVNNQGVPFALYANSRRNLTSAIREHYVPWNTEPNPGSEKQLANNLPSSREGFPSIIV